MLLTIERRQKSGMGRLIIPKAIQIVSGTGPGFIPRKINSGQLDALIDTGASQSCLPSAVAKDDTGTRLLRPMDYKTPTDWRGTKSKGLFPVEDHCKTL